ncbi:hypothetical protein MNBD_IGNAVI01-734 [hydrothermal vent metagenome]|uniref:Uncharacterized protein n=1 Tax=hydrothermal vent metagenome TaxID=652676 RepID=A0A3B1CCH9_9ZZZZ
MELFRIIYWSLIVFGLIALITILISYLTYQIRKKLGNIPAEHYRNNDRNQKEIVVKIPRSSGTSEIKQHHPKVVKLSEQNQDTGNYRDSRQNGKNRITILNDDLRNDDF